MALDKLLPTKKVANANPISELATELSQIKEIKSSNNASIGNDVIAAESLSSDRLQAISTISNNMQATIESIVKNMNHTVSLEEHNIEAATLAGIVATSPKKFLTTGLRSIAQEGVTVNPGMHDGHMTRTVSMEAYEERENRNAQTYSILYNLLASRQNDFGETFFPTIVINPTEVGILISIQLHTVYNDFKRSISGALADYGHTNIIRAYANSEILENELTRAVPILRKGGEDDNSARFVDTAVVPAWSVTLGRSRTVQTGALKVDQKLDLIGTSQDNELLNSGIMGPSDTLDADIRILSVFVKADKDVIRIDTSNVPGSTFVYSQQGSSNRMLLDLDTTSIVIDNKTKNVEGGALQTLTQVANGAARISLNLSGSVNINTGELQVNGGTLSLSTLRNSVGELVTGATADALADTLAAAEVIGYEIRAYRANSNIRQRGQLVDTNTHYRIINVPYRSPLATIAPSMETDSSGAQNTVGLESLISATGIRVSNEAVTALLKTDKMLAAYNPVADEGGNLPEITSIGYHYIKPVYMQEDMNLGSHVDSVKSSERLEDISASLKEKIRYMANELHRVSEYKAASDVLTGNAAAKPTVIVGTDPTLETYIQADGELTKLGDKFNVKVVSSIDSRMAGKIFLSFAVMDGSRNTSVNPLNFGNMLYGSELVSNMVIDRDGQTSRELMVTPRFAHINNLPILGRIDVTGLPAVVEKVQINTKSV